MKVHTSAFKENVKKFGRELDSIISYELGGETIELGGESLNSVTPHYEGAILKSVMRQLDIDSNVEIPVGTILTYQFGIKINGEYEYINFGNYVVYSSEKQEDTNSYKIVCYDKMLYSMKDYESIGVTYPITVRDYINAICTHLGLIFKNASDNFANYDKQIPLELYLTTNGESLGYTFRDVLDELAQATASTICINEEDDKLEIRYINDTGDTINEEYLKDINVNFGEYYGPINTIVLSRASGSDNIYLSQPQDLPEEQRNAIKIVDNQIMNRNDRDSYMSDILNRLYGLQYYLNDFSSTGITYYNLCDKYNVQIGENTYTCIMFNDEVDITQGLEEKVYTDMPEESETDYTKADKTDRRINQTYLIVDKQNQTIESVVSEVGEQNSKISQITQTVNEINSKISDIADITTSNETTMASMTMENINASEPIELRVKPITKNISCLYPSNYLYGTNVHYPQKRIIRFYNSTDEEIIYDYDLPEDLLYYDSENYDEFILNYGDGTPETEICQVVKRCKYNEDGSVSLLATPQTHNYSYPEIVLTDGDYVISIIGYDTGYIFARLMAKNIYTTQFYTKAETNSRIDQKADEIELGVDQTLSNYSTMNAAINVKANEITSTVSQTYATKTTTNQLSSRISQTAKNISLTVNNGSSSSGITIGITKEDGTTSEATGTIQMDGLVKFTNLNDGVTTISGSNIKTGTISSDRLSSNVITTSNLSAQSISASQITSGTMSANRINGGTINANNINVTNLNASNISQGSINGIPYNYYSSSNGSVNLGDNSNGPIMGYRGSSPRWSIASFTAGGRFQTFDSNGSMAAYFNQTGAHTSSDIRLKSNIVNINKEKSFDIINNLTPIQYTYKADGNSYHRGLSAQEVEKVLKDKGIEKQIYEIDKEGKYSLNYIELIPDLINCIKYLNEKIEKLERESDK